MSTESVRMEMPGTLYRRAQHAAQMLKQPLEQLLIKTLDTALPLEDETSVDELRADAIALRALSEDALWLESQHTLTTDQEAQLHALLEAQNAGALSREQETQLSELRREYTRVMSRKARTFAVLAERGYKPLD